MAYITGMAGINHNIFSLIWYLDSSIWWMMQVTPVMQVTLCYGTVATSRTICCFP